MTAAEPLLVFQDERLLVLDKPSGLLSVPGKGPHLADCLAARVQARWPAARVVHRLDRDTSGLLVMALDRDCQRHLSRQFEQRQVEKVYLAVVAGVPPEPAGRTDAPLRKDFARPPRHCVDRQHGLPALTEWRVLAAGEDRARLELRPRTGRSHQLRVHLAWLGHPILGDPLYAPPAIAALAGRLLLHAARLVLEHPTTGQRLAWEAACPF